MPNHYALIDQDGNVVNVISWDGVSQYTPPEGMIVVQTDDAGIGWTYADGVFTAPLETEDPME